MNISIKKKIIIAILILSTVSLSVLAVALLFMESKASNAIMIDRLDQAIANRQPVFSVEAEKKILKILQQTKLILQSINELHYSQLKVIKKTSNFLIIIALLQFILIIALVKMLKDNKPIEVDAKGDAT